MLMKRFCNVINHNYEKILFNNLGKYVFIHVNVLLISYLYCITLFILIILIMYSMWLLNILSVLLMFIVNVSNNSFSILLKTF